VRIETCVSATFLRDLIVGFLLSDRPSDRGRASTIE
jgi:hypothetical protein